MSISRPRTAQSSRPATAARPQTAASSRHEGSYVVAVIEARSVSREVGLAALDRDTGRLALVQMADVQTYVKTLHQMHLHPPCLVLVPDTFLSPDDGGAKSSGKRANTTAYLVECIEEEFPGVPIEPVLRKYWSETAGLEFLQQLCVDDDERPSTLITVHTKYYALSAACALLKHAETKLNTRFAAGSLRIRYVPVDGTMMIDPDTARNLELVNNMTFKKSTHTLFGLLNHTYTAMATRLLRVTILAPMTILPTIEARLDAVEELVQSEDRYTSIKDALKMLNKMDFDKLIASLAASETRLTAGAKPAAMRVTQMLTLRAAVKNLPILARALEGSRSQLLGSACDILSDPRIASISAMVDGSLNEDAAPNKNGLGALNARVYAVKANCNRLLDVARETYKENVGDIFALCRTLSEQHELPLQLVYQESAGGFVFALKKTDLGDGMELPRGFLNVSSSKGRVVFSTLELQKRNARMKDALDETLILSDKIIQDLVSSIIVDIGALYTASEAVALVDMLWSFAHVSIMRNYVRPEFTGTLAIKSGRHPVLESVQASGTLVANDVYANTATYFQIIHGPNMSGKSTYLQQIGLMSIMAMCACFVSAEYGSFRLHDALLTRLSNDDDIEKNLSTFANEMTSSAMILGLATSDSLVLIDELGRGTSPIEGVGISHAIAERLLQIKCYTYFATYIVYCTRQPAVASLHLSVHKSRASKTDFDLVFQYRITQGISDEVEHYGLELSRLADLPEDVTVEGWRIAKVLEEREARNIKLSRTTKFTQRRQAILQLRTRLTQAWEHSALPEEELLDFVARIQREVTETLRDTLEG